MEYISESPNHCSKGVLQCVQNCTNILVNKVIGCMFEENCSLLHQQFRKICTCYEKKGRKVNISNFLTKNSYPNQNN